MAQNRVRQRWGHVLQDESVVLEKGTKKMYVLHPRDPRNAGGKEEARILWRTILDGFLVLNPPPSTSSDGHSLYQVLHAQEKTSHDL